MGVVWSNGTFVVVEISTKVMATLVSLRSTHGSWEDRRCHASVGGGAAVPVRGLYRQRTTGGAWSAGKKFAELAVAHLSTADPKCRLDQSVVNVIEASLKQFSPSKAVDAFIHMENYALNLLEMPWKTEFHKIVVGFSIYSYLNIQKKAYARTSHCRRPG